MLFFSIMTMVEDLSKILLVNTTRENQMIIICSLIMIYSSNKQFEAFQYISFIEWKVLDTRCSESMLNSDW